MSLAQTLAWNTFVQIAGRAVGLVASFAAQAILIRHLGLAGFGQYTAATAFVALFAVLGESGLYLVSVRRASREPSRRPEILGTALSLRLLWSIPPLALAILAVYTLSADSFATYDPIVRIAVPILALNAYFTLLNQFFSAIFRIHLRMDLMVVGEVATRILALIAILIVVAQDAGLIWVVIVITGVTLCNLIYVWLVALRLEKFTLQWNPPLMRELLKDAVPLAALIILGLLRMKIDILLLYRLQTAEAVGIYGAAMRVFEVLMTFSGLFVALLFPLFSRLVTENRTELQRLFQKTLDVLLVGSVGSALYIILAAPRIADLLGAPPSVVPMRTLALALPPAFLAMAFSHLLFAEGKQILVLRLYAVLVVGNFVANYFAIHSASYLGAARVVIGTESFAMLAMAAYWILRRKLHLDWLTLFAVPWALTVGWLGTWLLRQPWIPDPAQIFYQVLCILGLGAVVIGVYLAGIFGFGILPFAELRTVLAKSRNQK